MAGCSPRTASLAAILLAGFAPASQAVELRLDEAHVLYHEAPSDFRVDLVSEPDDGFRDAIKFRHFGANGFVDFQFKVFIAKLVPRPTDDEQRDAARDAVQRACEAELGASVEKAATVHDVPGRPGASYCTLTDAAIPADAELMPGMFRNLAHAAFIGGDYGFRVDAYMNSVDDPLFAQFLRTLATIEVRESPAAAP